jgi:SAM-dependent methyltransferase
MSADLPLVADELAFIARDVPLAGRRVLDIGCGAGATTRRLAGEMGAKAVAGLEVSPARVSANREAGTPPGVEFAAGRAEALPFADDAFDVVLMQKSFHHVPVDAMDEALREAARVLSASGVLVVSEPVAAGAFDEVMRIFHDESVVRAEAQAALDRCTAFAGRKDVSILSPFAFANFAEFQTRMMSPDILSREVSEGELGKARAAYAERADTGGRYAGSRAFRLTFLRL